MTLLTIIQATLAELGEEQDKPELLAATENTALFGVNLDSMGIVILVTELEARISEELDLDIILADERAMSQKTSPFRSVKTLANYCQMLIDEAKAQ